MLVFYDKLIFPLCKFDIVTQLASKGKKERPQRTVDRIWNNVKLNVDDISWHSSIYWVWQDGKLIVNCKMSKNREKPSFIQMLKLFFCFSKAFYVFVNASIHSKFIFEDVGFNVALKKSVPAKVKTMSEVYPD